MSDKRNFVMRTIRKDGSVRIMGDTYRPSNDITKFAGVRAAFGLYYNGTERMKSFVFLWGTEEEFKYDGEDLSKVWPGPFCEDGTFKWEWWYRVGEA